MSIFGRSEQLSALRDEVERLSGKVKALQIEWDDFYDKAAKILRRIGRERVKLEAPPEVPEAEAETQAGETPFGFLTPAQKQAQQKILMRRAGLRQ